MCQWPKRYPSDRANVGQTKFALLTASPFDATCGMTGLASRSTGKWLVVLGVVVANRSGDRPEILSHAPNPQIRATLTDMARTWTRLTLKENRPPLQLVPYPCSSGNALPRVG